jgi:hypothetical protein
MLGGISVLVWHIRIANMCTHEVSIEILIVEADTRRISLSLLATVCLKTTSFTNVSQIVSVLGG